MNGWSAGGPQRLGPRPFEVIDRGAPLTVGVEGQVLDGFVGDTAASLLSAHGRRVFFGSLHQPRPGGVRRADRFDRNAWVWVAGDGLVPAAATEVRHGDRLSPFQRRAHTPTPIKPTGRWHRPGRAGVQRLAPRGDAGAPPWLASLRRGAGRVQAEPGGWRRVDVVVIGGGWSGLCAARAAAAEGASVVLVEADGWLGGSLRWAGTPAEQSLVVDRAEALDGVQVMLSAVATEAGPDGTVSVLERHDDRERLSVLHAAAVVVATGTGDWRLPFAGDHLPGVMSVSGVRRMIELWAVRPGTAAMLLSDERGRAATAPLAALLDGAGVAVVEEVVLSDGAGHVEADGVQELEEVILPNGRRVDADLLVTSFGVDLAVDLLNGLGGVVTPLPGGPAGTGDVAIGNLPGQVAVVGALAGAAAGGTPEEAEAHAVGTARRLVHSALDRRTLHRVAPPSSAAVVLGSGPAARRPVGGVLDAPLDIRVESLEGFSSSTPAAIEQLLLTARRPGLDGAARLVLADLARTSPASAPLHDLPLTGGGPLGGPSLAALAALDRPAVRQSPMIDLHRAAGARLVVSDGWLDVVDHGDPGREAEALERGVGLRDLSAQAHLEISGPAAAAVVADVLAVPIEVVQVDDLDDLHARSHGGPAPYQTVRTGVRTWQVAAPPGGARRLATAVLAAALAHDPWAVTVGTRHEDEARVRVGGPLTAALFESLSVELTPGWRTATRIGELAALVLVRALDDVELQVRADAGRALWAALLVAGDALGVCPVGIDAVERWRPS